MCCRFCFAYSIVLVVLLLNFKQYNILVNRHFLRFFRSFFFLLLFTLLWSMCVMNCSWIPPEVRAVGTHFWVNGLVKDGINIFFNTFALCTQSERKRKRKILEHFPRCELLLLLFLFYMCKSVFLYLFAQC